MISYHRDDSGPRGGLTSSRINNDDIVLSHEGKRCIQPHQFTTRTAGAELGDKPGAVYCGQLVLRLEYASRG
jgi:hypothetical protein